MEISQTAKGLFETGFDDDISPENMARILALFPTTERIADGLLELRDERGFVDMKRGELYPEIIGGVTRLRRTIASVYGIDFVQAQPNFACNGCIDTFLAHVQRLELTDGTRKGFLVATPTYFRYNHKVEALRMKLVDIRFPATYKYPVDEVIAALHERKPSCLFLVTPNNPTGLPIPDDELFQLLDNTPEDVCIAIDRTCANVDPEVSTKQLLHRYPHRRLAIFHSFSKYYGMSHLRIGFSVFSNKELASEVNRYLPFGLNLEALLKATHILATGGEFKPMPQMVENINANRRVASDFLQRRPEYKLTDFKSNYALLTLPETIDSKEFNARLQPHGIFVMPGHDFPQPNDRVVRLHTGGHPRYLNRVFEVIESGEKHGTGRATDASLERTVATQDAKVSPSEGAQAASNDLSDKFDISGKWTCQYVPESQNEHRFTLEIDPYFRSHELPLTIVKTEQKGKVETKTYVARVEMLNSFVTITAFNRKLQGGGVFTAILQMIDVNVMRGKATWYSQTRRVLEEGDVEWRREDGR